MRSRQVEAVALQLVANAVAATGTMDEHLDLQHVDYLSTIVVGLRQTENAVVVEVWDSSSEPPTAPAPVGHQSGYFMFGGGKVVWTAVAYPLLRRKTAPFTYPPPVEFSEPSQYSNDRTPCSASGSRWRTCKRVRSSLVREDDQDHLTAPKRSMAAFPSA